MSSRPELKAFWDGLRAEFLAPRRGTEPLPGRFEALGSRSVELRISCKVDDFIREIWKGYDSAGFALFAIGGYGREAMHPHSDIDLLFYFQEEIDEIAAKTVLHPLWDLGLKVGHQVRSAGDFDDFDPNLML